MIDKVGTLIPGQVQALQSARGILFGPSGYIRGTDERDELIDATLGTEEV